jgi:Zn ribbon nucleic-acid-binding protein
MNGVDTFRCLKCGYNGHGFHPDANIDQSVFEEERANNDLDRKMGVMLVPSWP